MPQGRQLGNTLRFHMEMFQDGINDSWEPFYIELREITKSLKLAKDLYAISEIMENVKNQVNNSY